MERKLLLVVVGILCVVLLASGQKPAPKVEPSPTNRYQLVTAQIWEGTSDNSNTAKMFLLDTATGRVWLYCPSIFTAGAKSVMPDMFQAKGFDTQITPERLGLSATPTQ
jgi:hypothetical protein